MAEEEEKKKTKKEKGKSNEVGFVFKDGALKLDTHVSGA